MRKMLRVAGLAGMGGWLGTAAGGADDGELAVGGHLLLVEQPRSARRGQAFGNAGPRGFAPVIVVARDAIQRRFDAGEKLQGFGQMPGFLDRGRR